ncbi:MAG: nuclear transport factor 2 family protein [Actinomycetota bacterium]
MTANDQLDRLQSHDDIRQLIARYCWALDTLDRELFNTVFTPDATARLGRGTQHGPDEMWALIHSVLATLDLSQHLVGSQLIDLHAEGSTATSRCHFHAQHVRASAEGGSQYVIAGRYDDQLVRTSHGWRIAHRKLTMLWTTGNAAVIGA